MRTTTLKVQVANQYDNTLPELGANLIMANILLAANRRTLSQPTFSQHLSATLFRNTFSQHFFANDFA
jgi:hypothetical protein